MEVLNRLHPSKGVLPVLILVHCPVVIMLSRLESHDLGFLLLYRLYVLVRRPVGERLVVDEEDLVDFTEAVLSLRFKSGCVLVAEEGLLLLLFQLV